MEISLCWLRRDLRIEDNAALFHSLKSGQPVLPLFIFDTDLINNLEYDDKRLIFLYDTVLKLKLKFESFSSTLLVRIGKPEVIFDELFKEFEVGSVYANVDYEPYSIKRDLKVETLCKRQKTRFLRFHDHVIYAPETILKADNQPYHVFTPYSKNWLTKFKSETTINFPSESRLENLLTHSPMEMPEPILLNLVWRKTIFPSSDIEDLVIKNYSQTRDFPSLDATTHMGIHLRFGTISVRKLAATALHLNPTFLNELIWREFYQMILFFHSEVVTHSFRASYDRIQWLNKPEDFEAWSLGQTGYPLVDAGIRQLVETGFMHNRVRMVTASFLTKHLLIDWRLGEAFFARYLLDYELASNNGGWQWAAGCGCDAVPYFRVFSPQRQQQRFDSDNEYIRRWLPEYSSPESYIKPIIEHSFARERAIGFHRKAQETNFRI